jgi:hypothetical protein
MKRIAVLLLAPLPLLSVAQVKIPKDANRFVYHQYDYGEVTDTSCIEVWLNDCVAGIETPGIEGTPVQGYAPTHTYIDYPDDSITVSVSYPDSSYYYRTALSRSDIEWKVEGPAKERKYTCSINSNTLVFVMDETVKQNATPLPYYGLAKGVLRSFTRNGQLRIKLVKSTWINNAPWPGIGAMGRRVSPRELDRIMKERLVVTTRIFDHEQICWGKKNDHVEGYAAVPFDTVLHYAGGTLILKRVKLPYLQTNYQHFIEIHQRSNGDAYDRTGSIFVILPPSEKSFFDGINNHPDSLPVFTGRDGQRYQGMMKTGDYEPPIELVRFFTPFGVGHFNDRMKDYGIEWRDETFYRQEITDIYNHITNDYRISNVIIGAWIGNYDGGGHTITVDIKSYPNGIHVLNAEESEFPSEIIPLFNTCNVLEMAGQNYGKLFATDSLTVTFKLKDIYQSARLRYISTGHGGWGEGDEFVPKTNTILIDGEPAFTHTPWRQDCGCYRDLNPISGNFWNGLSSSDFSRSGWCPGTATQPVYFDMSPWADGKEHTLTVAIPQGKPVEGMFSHWAVSGTLLIEY